MSAPQDLRARVAIDLGAESCRVSLLRWVNGQPAIELVHRIANGPVHGGASLRWPLQAILAGLDKGLHKAAERAPEGIASIAVDGWAVDYVRLGADGKPLTDPFCYRDERTLTTKADADARMPIEELFARTGAQPLRINTLYQLMADPASGIDASAPWVNLPEYILMSLGARRVAEYTNATHTGLVNVDTSTWDAELFARFGLSLQAAAPIVPTGTVVGQLQGPLSALPAFRATQLIAPACHDTASAIAGIPVAMDGAAYICSGTWSLVGAMPPCAVTSAAALRARYTNQGAHAGFLFHSNVNGMWLVKQCMDAWAVEGRVWTIEELVRQAEAQTTPGTVNVDAELLMLDGDMPARINAELQSRGFAAIPDVPGNEPLFARVIFESLAARYAETLAQLESMLDHKLERIHVLGGGSRNALLTQLTAKHTRLPVETGEAESSTIGNLAVQLASAEANGTPITAESVRAWAAALCNR